MEGSFRDRQAEIDERFADRGFINRLIAMCRGLTMPADSVEYRQALAEMPRLAAPVLAVVLPTLLVVAIFVLTSIHSQPPPQLTVDLARTETEPLALEEETAPDFEDIPIEAEIDLTVDAPNLAVADVVAPELSLSDQLSVKPADEDTVALVNSPVMMRSLAGSRTPGSIGQMTSGGAMRGDASTEGAVMQALRWLKYTQRENGSWKPSPVANTGFAVLAYLAHGETTASREFGETVARALDYLLNALYVRNSGEPTFHGTDPNEYSVLIATYALCEAYGMTHNPNLKFAAEVTLRRIIENQSPTGGWDYKLNRNSTRDDLSFGGWALQALKAGKMAGIHPEGMDECINKAIHCLKTRNFRDGGFNYTAGGKPTGLTATGCLAMQLLGRMYDDEVRKALDYMRNWLPSFSGERGAKGGGPLPGNNPQYYCYYAAQCKYQAGMCAGAKPENVKAWQEWNLEMKRLYPGTIITLPQTIEGPDGHPRKIGYWRYQNDLTCSSGGDVMTTCLCALQLMVYYRYLPTTSLDAANPNGDYAPEQLRDEVNVEVEI